MSTNYWLFKSEPGAYSYDNLVNDGVAEWDGVRNFQARNFLRDEVKIGDKILFYHSNASPPAAIGTAVVVRSGYPDHTAWDPVSDHLDPKSTPKNPIWYMVDIEPEGQFARFVTLREIRDDDRLGAMMLLRKGSRLSIQPVTREQFEIICKMGDSC
jgi:predicted RNA-binding protein with PUA-like domain